MMASSRLLCLFCIILTSNYVADATLQDFNDAFGFASNVTYRRLVFQAILHQFYVRIHNSALLEEFGLRVALLQSRDATFLETVLAVEGVEEGCRAEGLRLRGQFVEVWNLEVRKCAEETWESLNELASERFWPYFNLFTRDATGAAFQVVRTLSGFGDLMDGAGLMVELAEELELYQVLGDEQLAVLEAEVQVVQDGLEPMKSGLRDCLKTVEELQIEDHGKIMSFLEGDCNDDK